MATLAGHGPSMRRIPRARRGRVPVTLFGLCVLVAAGAAGLSLRTLRLPAASELPPPGADTRPAGSLPELPRLSVERPPEAPTGPVRVLGAGEDLQAALEAAMPGDVIAIDPGTVVSGPIRLPRKSGNDWITIRTRVADGVFPAAGTRVAPADAA